MKTTTSKNMYKILLKRVSVTGLLFCSMILGVQSASAATFTLAYNCGTGPCPGASAIWVFLDLDKTNYAPNEPVTMVGSVSSDDNPQPNNKASPIGRGVAGIFPASIDIFPRTYTDFEMTNDLVFGSVVLGNAPATPGSYNAPVYGGAGGYVSQAPQDIPFTVTGPQGVWCLTNETAMPNAMCTEPSRFGSTGVPLPSSCTIGDVQYRCEVDTGSTKLRDEYTCKASCAPPSVHLFFSH